MKASYIKSDKFISWKYIIIVFVKLHHWSFVFELLLLKPQINCPHARSDVKMCSWPASEKCGFFVSELIGITTSEFNIMQQIAPECTTSSQIHDACNHVCKCNISALYCLELHYLTKIYTAWHEVIVCIVNAQQRVPKEFAQ